MNEKAIPPAIVDVEEEEWRKYFDVDVIFDEVEYELLYKAVDSQTTEEYPFEGRYYWPSRKGYFGWDKAVRITVSTEWETEVKGTTVINGCEVYLWEGGAHEITANFIYNGYKYSVRTREYEQQEVEELLKKIIL